MKLLLGLCLDLLLRRCFTVAILHLVCIVMLWRIIALTSGLFNIRACKYADFLQMSSLCFAVCICRMFAVDVNPDWLILDHCLYF